MRGCDEGTTTQTPFPWAPDLDRCPWSVVPSSAFALLTWEQRRRRLGVLPMGTRRIGELPQWVVEALDAAASGQEVADGIEATRSRMMLETALARMGGANRGA